jgi:hypothetical protein
MGINGMTKLFAVYLGGRAPMVMRLSRGTDQNKRKTYFAPLTASLALMSRRATISLAHNRKMKLDYCV